MLRTLLLTFRTLREHPSRSLLTTAGIVLGVAVILATSITNENTLASIDSLFNEASGKADLVVMAASRSEQGFAERVQRRVAAVAGVEVAAPALIVPTLLADESKPTGLNVGFFVATTGALQFYGVDPEVDPLVRSYKMVAGEFLPPDGSSYEVVLVEEFAREKGIEVGEEIEVVAGAGSERLRVVGLMAKEGPGRLNNGAFGVLPLQAAQQIFGRSGEVDQIEVVAAPEAASADGLEGLKGRLQETLGDEYAVGYPASQGQRVLDMISTYQLGLNFFGAITLFVGAFLIYNAFSMTVVERTREIGLLRAIGMTRRQVMGQILSEAMVLALVGSVAGIGLGVLMARGLMRVMDVVLAHQDVGGSGVPPGGLLSSILVGIGVTLVAALVPAWQASRVTPLEALRARGRGEEGWLVTRGWWMGAALTVLSLATIFWIPLRPVARYYLGQAAVATTFLGVTLLIPPAVDFWQTVVDPLVGRLYGNEGNLGSRNLQRARLRTALTVAALMVGVAMIIGIQGMTAAFRADIEQWIQAYIGGDLFIYSSLPMRGDLGTRLETLPEVAATTPVRYVNAQWRRDEGEKEAIAFTGLDPASYQAVNSFVFEDSSVEPAPLLAELAGGDALFVSSALAERYALQAGDSMMLETRRGVRSFKIAAVVVDFYNQGMSVQGRWDDLRRYFGVDDVSFYFVRLEPGVTVEEGKRRIEELYGQRYWLVVESNEALRDSVMGRMEQTFGLFDVLALISVLVAAFGVVNTLTMSVAERTREIGGLRSLGMTRRQVVKMILAEALLIGLIGSALGILFGLFLSRVFLMAVTQLRGYELDYVLPVQGVVVSLFITLVVSQVAAIWPARAAARLRIVEAIQYE